MLDAYVTATNKPDLVTFTEGKKVEIGTYANSKMIEMDTRINDYYDGTYKVVRRVRAEIFGLGLSI